jgi:hypothetical protein
MTTNFFCPSLLLLFLDPGSGMGKNQDPGSGIINIPDPQHWYLLFSDYEKYLIISYILYRLEARSYKQKPICRTVTEVQAQVSQRTEDDLWSGSRRQSRPQRGRR